MVKKDEPWTSSLYHPVSSDSILVEHVCLPKVKSGLVPVLRDIGQIVPDNGPDDVPRGVGVAVINQPVGVRNQGSSTESWSVSLGPSPGIGELRQIHVELWLSLFGCIVSLVWLPLEPLLGDILTRPSPFDKSPDGFEIPCSFACAMINSSISSCSEESPAMN